MKKQLIALALSTALLAGSSAAIAPEEAFPAVNTYPGFADVAGSAWYAATVQTCYEVGLMTGTGICFAPDQVLTVGEVAAIAARMNEAITGDSIYLVDSTLPWYTSYVDYLEKLGVEVPDPVKQATRQEFIAMLAAVVPEDMLTPINQITALPDTADAAVLSFYNAGILTGVDDWGTFAPDKTLTRAETAAMVARVARPELRENFSPADYAMFTAAYLKPADVLFTNGVTAGRYLPYVQTLIDGLEADCAAQGMEFNWFNTVDGVTFLDYVEDTALAHFGVTAKDGTQLYQDFDMQVQFDAAVSPTVGQLKFPGSPVAGYANTFIFPNINAGNIGYKIAQRLGGFDAYGPILLGLNAPINDLSRGCNAQEVYSMAIITAALA